MPPEEDLIELKFRLYDGTDIGPFHYPPSSTVASLKDRIFSDWPKGFLFSVCSSECEDREACVLIASWRHKRPVIVSREWS
ncbi:hypothetical protein MLD38_000290 [Melastoma candidum]|uniref:Uncharacterized protein n=1 Tax=Melastoma candidum TaxID=119954 RepID=A0ACB9SAX0_9MYRT|nr:hypothetical protein MLD38_000290 [Melastoma candidum]